jgi:hypothetical protein
MTRPRGYADWKPHGATQTLLDNVNTVLTEYRDHLPMTLRQVFYRLVANHDYPKTEAGYSALCEKINRARRAGLIDWNAIRDDRQTMEQPYGYDDVPDYISTVQYLLSPDPYQRNRRSNQPTNLYVACETTGMVPMLARAVKDHGVTVISSGGFESVTMKRQLAQESIDKPLTVLHVGDHDPSGVHLFKALAEDVAAFAAHDGGHVTFERIAVLPEHIHTYDLTTAPPKASDRRAFNGETVQAEALPPDVLVALVLQAVEDNTDMDARDALLATEDAEREQLRIVLAPLQEQLNRGHA